MSDIDPTTNRGGGPEEEVVRCLRVARRRIVGNTAIIDLVSATGADLPAFTAGAHLELHLGNDVIRQYSLCNDPAERERYVLAVLLEPQSRGGSAKVHSELVEGAEVLVSGPRNHFPLEDAAHHTILLGGGIGITPILAMAWRLHRLGASFELHYCARTSAVAVFSEILVETPFADKVSIHLDDGASEQRFDADAVLAEPLEGGHVYVCGPGGFMDYVIVRAAANGWPEKRVHLERFSAEADVSGGSFVVRAAKSGVEVAVADGQTIVDALASAGIKVPMSCQQGVCGACLTQVIEGVPDHRDHYLLESEKTENGLILPCCSRSKTPVLVLAI